MVQQIVRSIGRHLGFTAGVTMTLAVGLGATITVSTLVHAVLVRPLPYPAAERLVVFGFAEPGQDAGQARLSERAYLHIREHAAGFASSGAYVESAVNLTDGDEAERAQVAVITPSVFTILQAVPLRGRVFTVNDGHPDAPSVVILSYGLWLRRYGADPHIIGRAIEVNRRPHEVIGIMPAGMGFPRPETELWYCLNLDSPGSLDPYLKGIARLIPGASTVSAQAELGRLIASTDNDISGIEHGPPDARASRVRVASLKEAIVGTADGLLWIAFGTVGLVLVATWASVTNLLLVRAERHREDVVLQMALGARRIHLAGRYGGEAVLLSLVGTGLALGLGCLGIQWRFGFGLGDLPRLHELRLDATVIGMGASLGLMTTIFVCLVALSQIRPAGGARAPQSGLALVGRGSRYQRVQCLLVTLQFGLAFVLLVGAVLMLRSFWRLKNADLGFNPAGVVSAEFTLPSRQYYDYHEAAGFYTLLLDTLRERSGILAIAAVSTPPLTNVSSDVMAPVLPEGWRASATGAVPVRAALVLATPGYFETVGIRFVEGRAFKPEDVTASAIPIVLSVNLATSLFGVSAIGQRLTVAAHGAHQLHTVVGVVGNVQGESIASSPARMLYLPVVPDARLDTRMRLVPRAMTVLIRSTVPMADLAPALRSAVRRLDAALPPVRLRLMDDVVAASTARIRLLSVLLLVSAGVAVLLTLVGTYGLLSYTISQRSRELGLRLAVGASPEDLSRMVRLQSIQLALAGIGLGVPTAFMLGRLVKSMLLELGAPVDPLSYAGAIVLVLGVAAAASHVPAQRAGRIAVAELLRAQ